MENIKRREKNVPISPGVKRAIAQRKIHINQE
jgi:hypothetical protein